MTVTNIDDLRKVFFASTRGDSTSPHWTLYGGDFGANEKRICTNDRVNDMEESFAFLSQQINALNNPPGATRFRVLQYPPKNANNYTGTYFVQIGASTQSAMSAASQPGIAGLPAGIGDFREYVAKELRIQRLEWEKEQLEAQIDAPASGLERIIEKAAEIPGFGEAIKMAVAGLVMKFNPAAGPAIAAAMNGTPTASDVDGDHDHDPATSDPQAVFVNNIQAASAALGTDPLTLSNKLRSLIEANPQLAKSLLE